MKITMISVCINRHNLIIEIKNKVPYFDKFDN